MNIQPNEDRLTRDFDIVQVILFIWKHRFKIFVFYVLGAVFGAIICVKSKLIDFSSVSSKLVQWEVLLSHIENENNFIGNEFPPNLVAFLKSREGLMIFLNSMSGKSLTEPRDFNADSGFFQIENENVLNSFKFSMYLKDGRSKAETESDLRKSFNNLIDYFNSVYAIPQANEMAEILDLRVKISKLYLTIVVQLEATKEFAPNIKKALVEKFIGRSNLDPEPSDFALALDYAPQPIGVREARFNEFQGLHAQYIKLKNDIANRNRSLGIPSAEVLTRLSENISISASTKTYDSLNSRKFLKLSIFIVMGGFFGVALFLLIWYLRLMFVEIRSEIFKRNSENH